MLLRTVHKARTRDDRGATAVEYGLLLAAVVVIIAGAVFVLGGSINDIFDQANNALTP